VECGISFSLHREPFGGKAILIYLYEMIAKGCRNFLKSLLLGFPMSS
jgi:hypothetical protein